MKRLFTILLFITFIAQPVTKLSVIGYYGLNVKKIVEKYCVNKAKPELKCNGKCYLKKQLQLSQSLEQESNAKQLVNISELFVPLFFEKKEISIPADHLNKVTKHHFFFPERNKNAGYTSVIDIPPEYSFLFS